MQKSLLEAGQRLSAALIPSEQRNFASQLCVSGIGRLDEADQQKARQILKERRAKNRRMRMKKGATRLKLVVRFANSAFRFSARYAGRTSASGTIL